MNEDREHWIVEDLFHDMHTRSERENKDRFLKVLREQAEAIRVLEEALEDSISGTKYIRERYGQLDGVGWNRMIEWNEALNKSRELRGRDERNCLP